MTAGQIQLFVDRSGAGVNWRLLAANNREVGRGIRLFADERSARIAIGRLQSSESRLVARAKRAPHSRWVWELTHDGSVVASSINTFDRLIRCEQVLSVVVERFVGAAVSAAIVDMTDRRYVSDRRTSRVREPA